MKMKRSIFYLFGVLILVVVSGCSKPSPLLEMNAEEAFRFLVATYDRGDWLDAANGFDFYTLNYSGASLVDSAQYMLGMSHFQLKEYLLTANAFDELTRRFPRSRLVPDAMFMVGLCYWELSPKYSLDQEYTNRALEAFQAFIDYFPEHKEKVDKAQEYIAFCREKLAHKEYASGVIYLKMKDYSSAAIYFQSVLERYYDMEWAPLAAFKLGVSLAGDKKYQEAEQALLMFLTKYPGHPWHSKAQSTIEDIHEQMAGGERDRWRDAD